MSGLSGRWEDNQAFFRFQSFHVPDTIYRYDVTTGEREVWWQFDAAIEAERFEV